MATSSIDAKTLSKMFLAGAKNLEIKKEYINELNVFPVPDGDTGTNMTLTIMSAAREVAALGDNPDMKQLSKAISSGSLRGARGNSGVILSQLCRGFCKVISNEQMISIPVLAIAVEKAVESAYKAVMKPKEGTILTVAKGIAIKAKELAHTKDMEVFLAECIAYGDEVLSKTPDMLPVLKQAGVVDSGGQGLIEVLKGCLKAYRGEEIDLTFDLVSAGLPKISVDSLAADTAHIKFGYCTEFIIMLNKTFNIKKEMNFKDFLESVGDSIVVVADDEIVKVHVHTNDPGIAIQRALTYGGLSNIKIDNMRLEHQEKLFKEAEKKQSANNAKTKATNPLSETVKQQQKEVGFISVSIGEGLNEILRDLGVDKIIEGGQTMNPSTDDILSAIEEVNAKNIFIFPNNKNIILAANQAQFLVKDKRVIVIPTKNIPQGITAIINYVPDLSVDENMETMIQEIESVKTGQVTYAVRNTVIDEKVINESDIMGIGDHGILAVGQKVSETTIEMVEDMIGDDEVELISIYYGEDIREEDAQKLRKEIEQRYSECDVELQFGGQPIYYYIISAE